MTEFTSATGATSGEKSERSTVKLNAPTRPQVTPCEQIQGTAETLRSRGLKETSAERVQEYIRGLDEILKEIADLQVTIGALRKELGNHVKDIRRASPKGKPVEGTKRVLSDGSTIAFISGQWVSIKEQTASEETKD